MAWSVGGFAGRVRRRVGAAGYSPATAIGYLRRFGNLSGWMASSRTGLEDLSPAVVERFCAACRAAGYRDYTSIRGKKPLLGFLRATGHWSEEPVPLSGRLTRCLSGSRSGSRGSGISRRGASRPTCRTHGRCRRLVSVIGSSCRAAGRLVGEAVRGCTCPRRGRASAKLTVVAVRQLLTFLYAWRRRAAARGRGPVGCWRSAVGVAEAAQR